MTHQDVDYRALGFKCGLEIHQQLLTEKKLFCRCPVLYQKDEGDITILRHMRPTLSEMGTYDGTALMEFKTKKNVLYHVYNDSVCTYEMDDTPPFPIDQNAVDIALEITMLLGCKLVDEMHIIRKQYLDGSIPTGFQRTGITGVEGEVPFGNKSLHIRQLSIEEDSCREMWDRGHTISFKTDRLGTPLIEVVTEPDIDHPSKVAEAASFLGRVMRSTGRVRTGLGATRQDVNVSITGGTRVEIKGVPKLGWMESLTANEALRQKALLEIRDELLSRGEQAFRRDVVTDMFTGVEYEPIVKTLDDGGAVGCLLIEKFRGIMDVSTQPGITFFQEFSDRVRVIACLDRVPNIIHTGTMDKVFSPDVLNKLMNHMGAREDDELLLVWGPLEDVNTALGELEARVVEARVGVPGETRQAFEDGTTGFERILPGPDRMYPDTDHPPFAISPERIEDIRRRMSEPSWSREERYINLGASGRSARLLSFSPLGPLFEKAVDKGAPARSVERALLVEVKRMKRLGVEVSPGELMEKLAALKHQMPMWAWVRWVMEGGPEPPLADHDAIHDAVAEAVGCDIQSMMGSALGRLGGWAPIPLVMEAVRERLGADGNQD